MNSIDIDNVIYITNIKQKKLLEDSFLLIDSTLKTKPIIEIINNKYEILDKNSMNMDTILNIWMN